MALKFVMMHKYLSTIRIIYDLSLTLRFGLKISKYS